MSPLDVPFAVTLICLSLGMFIGFGVFVAVCAVIERWRR